MKKFVWVMLAFVIIIGLTQSGGISKLVEVIKENQFGKIPDWVPYPFTEKQEDIRIRQGAGSFCFETKSTGNEVQDSYAETFEEAGWKVHSGYDGGHYVQASSPDGQRVVAVISKSTKEKTDVVVNFMDIELATSGKSSPPEGIPNWVPIYPGKVENISIQGNDGEFSITTPHSANQVRGLYAGLLSASDYKVATTYDGSYYARGTSDSKKHFISVKASTIDNETTVIVKFEQQ